MAKPLNDLDRGKRQFLDVNITHFSVEEILRQIVNHMFISIIVILYQNHGNCAKCSSQIEGKVTMIVGRTY